MDIEQQQEEDDSGVLDWIKGSRENKRWKWSPRLNQCCVYSLEKWSTKVILLEELVCFSAWVKKIQPSGISEVALLYTPVPGNRAFSVTYRKIHPSFPPPFFRFSINFTQTTLIKNRPAANNVVTPGYTLNPEKDKKKNHSNGCCLFSLRNSLLLEDTFTHPSSDGK